VSWSSAGGDGLLVELQVGHQPGDFHRMREVRVARCPLLRAVFLHGVNIGAVQHRLVHVGFVGLDPFHQFVLPEHLLRTMWANGAAMQRKKSVLRG
jgi:hypothetical protein